jgi:hypothetical protein
MNGFNEWYKDELNEWYKGIYYNTLFSVGLECSKLEIIYSLIYVCVHTSMYTYIYIQFLPTFPEYLVNNTRLRETDTAFSASLGKLKTPKHWKPSVWVPFHWS